MKPFSEIAPELGPDGALRDFYVFDLGSGDLQAFLDHIRPKVEPNSFVIDGKTAPLPQTIEEIRKIWDSASPCLSIPVGSGFLCWHFFMDTELELDFLPSDYGTEHNWGILVGFLTEICTLLNHRGIVCHENSPDFLIETIEPEAEPVRPANAATRRG